MRTIALSIAGLVVALTTMGLITAPAAAGVDLTRGASTVVPASMNPGLRDAFGDPYVVRTRVTGARFHVGTSASTARGGLSATPWAELKQLNGVRFYEITGELSGVGQSPVGFEYVYGPLDGHGADRSRSPSNPRYGLAGVPFRLLYPASGWNGRLIVYRNGGDGGQGSGHYLYQSVADELELVRRGYAWFVTLGGGTTPPDSNPDSLSKLFWQLAPPFWAADGEPHRTSFRIARIGADWSERRIEAADAGKAWFPGDDRPFPISSDTNLNDLFIWMQDDVPTFRDQIAFAKHLLEAQTARRPAQTGVLAWSRSGVLALGMNSGRTAQLPPSAIAPSGGNPDIFRVLTARTGGNYVMPYQPESGLVADWFVVRAGIELAYVAKPSDPDFFDQLPDPEYPVTAPFIYIVGETDLPEAQFNGYYLVSVIAGALPGSKVADKDVNHWVRLYSLKGVTHHPREAWFAGSSNGGGANWYDPFGAGLNQAGRGLEFPVWADRVVAPDPFFYSEEVTGMLYSALVREEGFSLQAIFNADRWSRTGVQAPTSVADANLVTDPTETTRSSAYPVEADCTYASIFGTGDVDTSCVDDLARDSILDDPGVGFPLDFGAFLMREFKTSGLRYTTEPIQLPDQAAPLGFRLITPTFVFRRPFTADELRARYRSHGGYVEAVRRAVNRLVARGLYEPSVGVNDVAVAAQSHVLR